MDTSCCYHWYLLVHIWFPKYLLLSRYSSSISCYSYVPLVLGLLIMNITFLLQVVHEYFACVLERYKGGAGSFKVTSTSENHVLCNGVLFVRLAAGVCLVDTLSMLRNAQWPSYSQYQCSILHKSCFLDRGASSRYAYLLVEHLPGSSNHLPDFRDTFCSVFFVPSF